MDSPDSQSRTYMTRVCISLKLHPPGAAILALMLPDNVSSLRANSPAKSHQLPELPWAAEEMTLSQGEALRS